MKSCSTCAKVLPAAMFHVRRASRDGRTASCRACLADRDRARESPERAAMRQRYASSPEGRRKSAAAKKRYARLNPHKRAAHAAVHKALREGKLRRKPCEVCGTVVRIHGHHDDYAKPLSVRWLCQAHHKLVHAMERRR